MIYRAVGFIRATVHDYTGKAVRRFLKSDPDLVMATKIRTGDRNKELELQCRLLAGETPGAVAVEIGSTRTVVDTYAKYFFDVRHRLQSVSYIRHRVCQVPLDGPAPLPALAMLSSYTHGSMVVPAWLDYLDHADEAHDLTTEIGRQRESIELYVAAKNLSVGCSQPLGFAKRLEFLVNLERKMYRSRPVNELFALSTAQMLSDSVNWRSKPSGLDCAETEQDRQQIEMLSINQSTGLIQPICKQFD